MFIRKKVGLIILPAIALVFLAASAGLANEPQQPAALSEDAVANIDYTMWHLGNPEGDFDLSETLQKRLYNAWWYAGSGEFAGYDMFQTPQSGMGIGSNYVRSELREIIPCSYTENNDWGVSAAWGMQGYHRMTTVVKAALINDDPRGKYKEQNYTCIGQLWGQSGGSGCMFELRYKDTGKFNILPTKPSGNLPEPDVTIPVGLAFTVTYECNGGVLKVWVESREAQVAKTQIHEENMAAPDSGSYYFKAGNYDLSSDATANVAPDPHDIHTLIGFQSIVVEHNPIRGRLSYANGSPVAHQTISYVLNGSGADNIRLTAETDGAGYYYIPNVPSNGGEITAGVAITAPEISGYTADKNGVVNVAATPTRDISGIRSGSAYNIVYTSDGQPDGYGSNGKFLAPIGPADTQAIKIYTAQDLYDIRLNLSGSYIMMNDIDLADFTGGRWTPIGDGGAAYLDSATGKYVYPQAFGGILDGGGYVIKNLTVISETTTYDALYAGLFGVTDAAIIKNLGLENTNISTTNRAYLLAGGLAGYMNNSSLIYNCYNTGVISNINANYSAYSAIGGLCGRSENSASFSCCYNSGDLSSSSTLNSSLNSTSIYLGGITGYSSGTIAISQSNNSGNLQAVVQSTAATSTSDIAAGGVFGYSEDNITVSNCYNTGDIAANATAYSNIYSGGIGGASRSSNNISHSYNSGNISADCSYASSSSAVAAAGICGIANNSSNNPSFISECYNTGDVYSAISATLNNSSAVAYAGGIGGRSYSDCSNCYNTGYITSSSSMNVYSGGIGGYVGRPVANCYNLGDITATAEGNTLATANSGGINGYSSTAITNCYSAGSIFASSGSDAYAAGICGRIANTGAISSCFALPSRIWAESALGAANVYSYLICYNYTNIVKTTNSALSVIEGNAKDDASQRITATQARLKTTYTAAGWDFDALWDIEPLQNNGYPFFAPAAIKQEFEGAVLYQTSTNQATVQLYNSDGLLLDTVLATAGATGGAYTFSAGAGTGYTLKISKPGYLSYTIKNLTLTENGNLPTVDLRQMAGDIDGDGVVNATDLTYLLSEFNRNPANSAYPYADIDGNGVVNATDLTYLLAGFNKHDVEIIND